MLLDDLRLHLANLTLLERIRVPRLETIFLRQSWVTDALCAMRLQNHEFECAGLWAGHFRGGSERADLDGRRKIELVLLTVQGSTDWVVADECVDTASEGWREWVDHVRLFKHFQMRN
jgi:hypothetical protein